MNIDNFLQEETNLSEQESSEAKVRAAIKKYSCYSKTFPKTEWWDWDSD